MRVIINDDLVISSNGESGLYLSPPLQGLDLPPIRTASGNYSGRDGGWVASQFFSSREIVVNGVLYGQSCDNADELRCLMNSMMPIRQSFPFVYVSTTGQRYFADVYLRDLSIDIVSKNYAPFTITLVAPDPYLYDGGTDDNPGNGWIEQPIYKIIGGGYVTPYVLPVEWAASTQPTIVNNPNDVLIYPQIVLEGTFTNPQIINETTGQFIGANITTTAGDVIVFDLKERTVTLNGGSVLPAMTGSWWPLVRGDNYISLMSYGGSDDDEGTIRYRIAYTGVGAGC